jgi:hypothetical protein
MKLILINCAQSLIVMWCHTSWDNFYVLSWTFPMMSSSSLLVFSFGCFLSFDLVLSLCHIYMFVPQCVVGLRSLLFVFCLCHLLFLFFYWDKLDTRYLHLFLLVPHDVTVIIIFFNKTSKIAFQCLESWNFLVTIE